MTAQTHDSITATELVRSLSTVIDQVRITGNALYITKGSQTVAELCPPPKSGLPVKQLCELLHALPSLGNNAAMMANDIKTIRDRATLPENSWG